MGIETVSTIIISILGSSLFSVLISTFLLEPMRERKKYVFDEKKRVYESIIIFAQIVLFPAEAKYSLGVAKYDIKTISEEESVRNSLNDLKMAIPKLKLVTKNSKVIESTLNFIEKRDEQAFIILTDTLQHDLFK